MVYALFSKEEVVFRCEKYIQKCKDGREKNRQDYITANMEYKIGIWPFKVTRYRTREEAEEYVTRRAVLGDFSLTNDWLWKYYAKCIEIHDREEKVIKLLELANATEKELFINEKYSFLFKENNYE